MVLRVWVFHAWTSAVGGRAAMVLRLAVPVAHGDRPLHSGSALSVALARVRVLVAAAW